MRVLDLFSGLHGWTQAFLERGHEIFSVDIDHTLKTDLRKDVKKLRISDLPWMPDAIVASPPCDTFSVAVGHKYWGSPRMEEAMENVRATVRIIDKLRPDWFLIENPVGKLRGLGLIPYEKYMTTLCRYGLGRMKPTDFWGKPPEGFHFKKPCANGDWCHLSAKRGSHTGTQNNYTLDYRVRAMIPHNFSLLLCLAAEKTSRF